jgi:hypothetical protein
MGSAYFKYNVVGTATGYGLDYREVGFRVLVGSKIFFMSSTPVLGSTQPPIQQVPGALSRGLGGQSLKLISHPNKCRVQENVDLYIHSPIRLHRVMFN